MNEYVHVTFVLGAADYPALMDELLSYEHNINILHNEYDHEVEYENDLVQASYFLIGAKVNSEFLTVLRLSGSKLTKDMRVSYIPDELKDKYRKMR